MVTVQAFSIIIILGFVLYILGRQLGEKNLEIFGGLTIFLCGVLILLYPLININDTMNLVFGAMLFGVGAMLWVTSTTNMIGIDDRNAEDD
jgi:peptidoglycan/LPS O-acetylase OafA/YrhL